MRRCFEEYFRVLKPGRWMTVVFSNSSNGVWRAIQEAMGVAGFVVADVRTLDKQQGSYRQVTSSAVKQDLVISAYKPSEALEKKFVLGIDDRGDGVGLRARAPGQRAEVRRSSRRRARSSPNARRRCCTTAWSPSTCSTA